MARHERIGGSRAQRDLIEYALVVCLLRSNSAQEARNLLRRRAAAAAVRTVGRSKASEPPLARNVQLALRPTWLRPMASGRRA